MRSKDFLKQIRIDEVAAAVRAAESLTSGEVRVFVSRKHVDDPVAAAQAEFVRLGMTQTRERNAVLIFVAPSSQVFAVIGDLGIHEKCGESFWQELAVAMGAAFRNSRFTEGIVLGIQRAGQLLGNHFPRRPDDRNELPDRVAHD